MTRSALLMAQNALTSASGSNEEPYGKMISQAESAVKEAKEKGLEANQALKERQDALDKLKKEAAEKKKEVKQEMAKVRLKADLDAGVHPRARADKDRQRAASHRAATGRERSTGWKRFEEAPHGHDHPEKWDKEDMGTNLPGAVSQWGFLHLCRWLLRWDLFHTILCGIPLDLLVVLLLIGIHQNLVQLLSNLWI